MLFSLFSNLVEIFSFLNVFKYLTVRTGLAMFTSMIVVFLVGGPLINYFSSHQIHDPIREDGPSDHIVKKRAARAFFIKTEGRLLVFKTFSRAARPKK